MKRKLNKATILAACLTALPLLLTGCKTLDEIAQSTQYEPPVGVELLDEAEIREAFVGNTVTGESNRVERAMYVEHYLPDGKIKGLWNGDPYSGKWALSGNIWCGKYQNSQFCNTIAREGDKLHWVTPEGEVLKNPMTVLAGNAKKL